MRPIWIASALLAAAAAWPAAAGEADVIDAKATKTGQSWRIDATVRHADEGWDHYANAFEVIGPGGEILGTRTLFHPHVEEQPFTRSVTVSVPDGVTEVTIRAVDSVHGRGGKEFILRLEE